MFKCALLLLVLASSSLFVASQPLLNGQNTVISSDLLLEEAFEVRQSLTVRGSVDVSGEKVTVRCGGGTGHAFIVRQASLTLKNVDVTGCSSSAIVLLGPGATLKATNVRFSSSSGSTGSFGLVIAAQDAEIVLESVTIHNNAADVLAGQTQAARNYSSQFHPTCRDSSATGGVSIASRASSGSIFSLQEPACGSPALNSSLIHLQDSNFTAAATEIHGNTADAIITATGWAQQSLKLLKGSRISGNKAAWLIVADSWSTDAIARANMMAAQPSSNTGLSNMQPPFTTHSVMGTVRQQMLSNGTTAVDPVPHAFVGQVPRGQVPLQVTLTDVSISNNTVINSLMWLRLVNTSLTKVVISNNVGTGSRAGPQVVPGQFIAPPSPCDTAALQRALIQVHGPAAFDMHRCSISSNLHLSGALLHVTDGLALTSVRSSSFSNNTATALLRFEGRTWVLNTTAFFEASQYLDVMYYTEYEGSSQAAYKYAERMHAQQLVKKGNSSLDALWFMSDCTLTDNTVFHALLLSVGSRTSWREYISRKAEVLDYGAAAGNSTAAEQQAAALPLENWAGSWWITGCKIHGNRLALPAATAAGKAAAATAILHGDSFKASGTAAAALAAAMPAATTAAAAATVVPANWPEYAGLGVGYADAVAVLLTADEALQSKLVTGSSACYTALQQAYQRMLVDLSLRRTTHARLPAILWATTSQGYLANTSLRSNTGFSHIARTDNTMVTVHDVEITKNVVNASVVDGWYGDIWLRGVKMFGNVAKNGSIVDLESFKSSLEQVFIANNTAGTPISLNRSSKSNSSSSSAPSCTLSPVVRLSNLEITGALQNVSVTNNTGTVALDVSGFSFQSPMQDVLVADNAASGVRMLSTLPKYNGQGITINRLRVLRNALSAEASHVGGLVLGGFSSPVGSSMAVSIQDSTFKDNRPDGMPDQDVSVLGGGIQLQGPTADTADPSNQHGFLQSLTISISNTTLEGNIAAEGGGLWSAWPVQIHNCTIRNNTAILAGGGVLLKGLQNDVLGSKEQSTIINTLISDNVAGFGGGIACDNCRALLMSNEISGNTAVRPEYSANSSLATVSSSNAGKARVAAISTSASGSGSGSRSSSSREEGNDASSICQPRSRAGTPSAEIMSYQVRGAGGAIAANMAGNSYLILCGNFPPASRINPNTLINPNSLINPNRIINNHAEAVGGAVYVNYTATGGCTGPQAAAPLASQCFAGALGFGRGCGLAMIDADWTNSSADAGGDLLGWAGSDGFSMICSSVAGCGDNSSNSGNSTGYATFSIPVGGAAANSSRNNSVHSSQELCLVRFTAKSDGACLPAVAAGGSSLQQQQYDTSNGSSSNELPPFTLMFDPNLKFELPTALAVYNSTCLQRVADFGKAGRVYNYSSCAVAGVPGATVPRVFSGDDMNFTVQLGGREFGGGDSSFNSPLGTIQLHPSNDGLFVIGALNTSMATAGVASFPGMALQPVQSPISNRVYQFSFAASFGDDLLRQVQAVTVQVELQRCTLGQFMTINRCVRCNPLGTFSLNPNVQCQSCPVGGACLQGLLMPAEGYFSYNPFVPQILPCPLKGACQMGPATDFRQVKALMENATVTTRSSGDSTSGRKLLLRRLLQIVAADSGTSRLSHQRQEEQQQEEQQREGSADESRTQALLAYQSLLASAWTSDPTEGVPVLADVDYAQLLQGWHQLQCSPGYTGMLCGTCDTNYTSLTGGPPVRYGGYLGKCVPCSEGRSIWAILVGLFFILFLYNAFGICMQLYAPQQRQPNRPFSQHLHRTQAKRFRTLQQQISTKSSLPAVLSSQGSIPQQQNGDLQNSLASSSSLQTLDNVPAAHSADDLSTATHAAAGGGGGHAAGSSPNGTAAAVAPPAPGSSDMDEPDVLELRPSSLLGKPLGPIPSESLELGPFACAQDGQLQQLQLADGSNSVGNGTAESALAGHHHDQQQQQQQQWSAAGSDVVGHGSNNGGSDVVRHGSSNGGSRGINTSSITNDGLSTLYPDIPYSGSLSVDRSEQGGSSTAAATAAVGQGSLQGVPTHSMNSSSLTVQQQQQQLVQQYATHMPNAQMQPRWWQQQPQQRRSVGRHDAAELAHMQTERAAAAAAAAAAAQQSHCAAAAAHAAGGSADPTQQSNISTAAAAATAAGPGDSAVVVTCPSVGSPATYHHLQQQQQQGQQQQQQQRGQLAALASAVSVISGSSGVSGGPTGSAAMGGPVSLLVGMWKVLTSYVQVLAMVRFVHLRMLPGASSRALAFPDLSAFSSYVAFDCLIGGPQEYHAIIRTAVTAVGIPILLLLAALIMWLCCWSAHHIAAKIHRRYGHAKWNKLRRLQADISSRPDELPSYLQPRMLITVIVLAYSCYPLVTSSLLHTLACDNIHAPDQFTDPSGYNYSRLHFEWLEYRAAALLHDSYNTGGFNSNATGVELMPGSSKTAAAATVSAEMAEAAREAIQICAPGYRRSLADGLCWVAGMYWQQDYSIKCFVGAHYGLAMFGVVGLAVFGLALPCVAALLLWHNRPRLADWDFAWKYCFLYGEYRDNVCYWEFVIMARKLLFLAITILLPMALSGTEEEVALLQLQVCVMLTVGCLLVHTSLKPYKRGVLNRLERMALTTIAISFSLLSCAVAIVEGRTALLVLLGLVNLATVLYFCFHMFKVVWELIGDRVRQAGHAAMLLARAWLKKQQPHQH